jgi:multimeric flavodoxin WrbA
MDKVKRVIAIVGTYRKGGIVDSAVDEVLAGAKAEGAEVVSVHLMDKHIEFCTNCRSCTQQPGTKRGECVIADDMNELLDEIEKSDYLVLASPMNFWTVTAVTKRFMERLVCYADWPWKQGGPKMRNKVKTRRAVIVASSAAPSLLARLMTNIVKQLKGVADVFGAKTVGTLFIGLAAINQNQTLSERTKRRAQALGRKLVSG